MQPGVKGTEYSDRGGAGFGRVRRFFSPKPLPIAMLTKRRQQNG